MYISSCAVFLGVISLTQAEIDVNKQLKLSKTLFLSWLAITVTYTFHNYRFMSYSKRSNTLTVS
jgi:hypothetical protein